jgi:hypothetical protein
MIHLTMLSVAQTLQQRESRLQPEAQSLAGHQWMECNHKMTEYIKMNVPWDVVLRSLTQTEWPLTVEAISTSGPSANFYNTTQYNTPEHSHLHIHCPENLKSHTECITSYGISKGLKFVFISLPLLNKKHWEELQRLFSFKYLKSVYKLYKIIN